MDLLIVEDNVKLNYLLRQGLEEAGFEVTHAYNLEQAQSRLQQQTPRLIILDVGLPDGNGYDFLRELRTTDTQILVMMLTARGLEEERVRGLVVGADDYVVKPFSFPELVARINRHLARAATVAPKLNWNGWVLDNDAMQVTYQGHAISLRLIEMRILAILLGASGQVVPRQTIYERIWPDTYEKTPLHNTLEVHISRIREKITEEFGFPGIITVRGEGYSMGCLG